MTIIDKGKVMKLNLIYGRSGTGKSEYIYNDIFMAMSFDAHSLSFWSFIGS